MRRKVVLKKRVVIEEKDFPWPRKGDHLFVEREDWYSNAVLNGQRDNLSLYAVGYKRAGEMLDDISGFPTTHKIAELREMCRPLLNQEELYVGDQVLDAIEELITEFADVDEDSYAFRYPTDTKNNPSLPDLSYVNLLNFAEVIKKMAHFLEALSWQLSVILEQKQESSIEIER
jgi:hypothetical protein